MTRNPAPAPTGSALGLSRLVGGLRVRLARARARRAYRRMLALDDVALGQLGVTRDDVRLALLACGGSG